MLHRWAGLRQHLWGTAGSEGCSSTSAILRASPGLVLVAAFTSLVKHPERSSVSKLVFYLYSNNS